MDDKQFGDAKPMPPYSPGPQPAKSSGAGWIIALVLVGVLVASSCLCLPIMAALLLPAVQAARESARSLQSSNNLKQIGLAMHNYHTAHGALPPAYIPDEDGRPMTSWRTLILPQLEQQNLYDMVDFSKPWNAADNASACEVDVPVYRSPRDPAGGIGLTNYVAITGAGTMMPGAEATRFDDVRDGMSNTIMIVEVTNSDIAWAEPRDLTIDQLQRVSDGADPARPNVVLRRAAVLFGDGAVMRLNEEVTHELLKQYSTRSGGEAVPMWPGN